MPRAGTTLFRSVLDASPMIISGPETAFFLRPFALQQRRAERVAARIDRALDLGAPIIQDIIQRSTSAIACFDELMTLYRSQAGVPEKTIWAEKTPWNCASYHWLHDADSDAAFISLIRDPRDAATSIRDGAYYQSPQVCLETLQLVRMFDTPSHTIVRYEDMVTDPSTTFARVFEALGLPMGDALTAYREPAATRDPTKVRQPRVHDAIDARSVGRWRDPDHAARVRDVTSHPLWPSVRSMFEDRP